MPAWSNARNSYSSRSGSLFHQGLSISQDHPTGLSFGGRGGLGGPGGFPGGGPGGFPGGGPGFLSSFAIVVGPSYRQDSDILAA